MEKLNLFSNAEVLPLGSIGHACNCPANAFQNVHNLAVE